MDSLDLKNKSALDIGKLVNNKEIKAIEVLDYFKNRIENRNYITNAFVYTKFDEAYETARKIDNKIAKGIYAGNFAGVPFALKDFLPNKPGWTSSHGGVECLISTDNCYSEFCKAMESEGGIAIGKTNAPAYGFRGTTDNKLYGPTSTPFKPGYNSGGSSGGSAAAVADGLVPIAEGGDAGGSIRIPAAWCNLFGFKPGVGAIPSVIRPDAWSATHPFCVNFALTKNVEDAVTLFKVMNYYNSRDPYSIKINLFDRIPEYKNYKIALTLDFDLFEVDEEIKNIISNIAYELNCSVDLISFNFKHDISDISRYWCQSLMFDSVIELQNMPDSFKLIQDNIEQFPEELLYWINKTKNSTIDDLYKFNLIRTDILDNFENVFDNYDFIISPVSCCMPVKNSDDYNTKGPQMINGKAIDPLIGWSTTYLANMVGYPAMSIPAKISKEGFPVGMQVISRKYSEFELLNFAKLFEINHPWKNNFSLILE